MAINIFSGSSSSRNNKPKTNVASNTVRAQNARAALQAPAETSGDGSTAVKTGGTLQKVGNFVGKAAGIASKFLPGIGGTIAGAVSNLLNDPEWWQSVPGDSLTLNEPLRMILVEGADSSVANHKYVHRAAIGEIVTMGNDLDKINVTWGPEPVIWPTNRMITQYLLPQVRKVVNAVPLQEATDYMIALCSGASIYAMWRQLLKYDYMCKHGQTYLASMNDQCFPLFQTTNAAWLQSTINRLEEYLRANVRLPHTLCEYLAWRFGRVYKSNSSVKSGLILYDFLSIAAAPKTWDTAIQYFTGQITGSPTVQKANTDLYNAYIDHDYQVVVRDDTQFTYDTKEFMLRCNLQGASGRTATPPATIFALDSSLDNPTGFMATSVSAWGRDDDQNGECLFPVAQTVYVYMPSYGNSGGVPYKVQFGVGDGSATATSLTTMYGPAPVWTGSGFNVAYPSGWCLGRITMDRTINGSGPSGFLSALSYLSLSKSLDLYNCGIYVPIIASIDNKSIDGYIDVTGLSIDAGAPTFTTLFTEHIYAFANLVDIDRKHSMSYKQAEKLVARDTAEMISKLDVAAPASEVK